MINENLSSPLEIDIEDSLYSHFPTSITSEQKYQKIIQLGRFLAPFIEDQKSEENLVPGCQSIVYLSHSEKEGKLYFNAYSEALISSGLAYLCTLFYSGRTPEEILKTPPYFIERLDLGKSLTPGRSNGVASMVSIIKKKALNFILNHHKNI